MHAAAAHAARTCLCQIAEKCANIGLSFHGADIDNVLFLLIVHKIKMCFRKVIKLAGPVIAPAICYPWDLVIEIAAAEFIVKERPLHNEQARAAN